MLHRCKSSPPGQRHELETISALRILLSQFVAVGDEIRLGVVGISSSSEPHELIWVATPFPGVIISAEFATTRLTWTS